MELCLEVAPKAQRGESAVANLQDAELHWLAQAFEPKSGPTMTLDNLSGQMRVLDVALRLCGAYSLAPTSATAEACRLELDRREGQVLVH